MKNKHKLLRKLAAFTLAAGLLAGGLAIAPQPASAAAKFKVTRQNYSKSYTLDDGTEYFTVTAKFPKLKGTSAAVKKINKEITQERTNWLHEQAEKQAEYKEQYEEILEYNKESETPIPWIFSDTLTYKVTANNADYFSVMLECYDYTGGAHGMPYRICMTFSSKTGKRLNAGDVLGIKESKVNAKVRKLYLAKYDKEGANAGFYTSDDDRATLENALKTLDFTGSFYVKGHKVVFYSYPYELGPYASGFIEVSAKAK